MSRIDLALHLSLSMTATEEIAQILVLLTLVVRVRCSIGISRNDINLKVDTRVGVLF